MTMTDEQILAQIHQLVAEEHKLREQQASKGLTVEQEQAHMKRLETALDQCWDLLRQRRALKDVGEDPARAHSRPGSEVEGYLQ